MSSYDPAAVDLLSAEVRRDPYPYFAWLRTAAPVMWSPPLNAFLVSRYDDVAAIMRDPATFSSIAMRRSAPGRDTADRGGHSVITSDPPEHTRLRRILQDEFRMRPLRELEPRIRELVAALGAHLGRLEARVALKWLVPRLGQLERGFDTVHWNSNWFVRGPEALPLRRSRAGC